ncbi:MAG: caspase family protein, partial [Bacteroidota bacterium]
MPTDKAVVRRPEAVEPAPSLGKNYLLVIAIDAYEYCPTLYNCVADAKRLIDILTQQYQFEKKEVTTLFNEKATEGNIFSAFRSLATTVTEKDNLVIYFSGHGEYDKVFEEGYWIPVNAQLGATEDCISNSKIKTILSAIKSKHTFLIVDSCFSGSLFAKFRSVAVAEKLEESPSRWGLTAGRNEVVSDGKPGDHSPFAESMLYHLEKNESVLGVAELCNKVIEDVVTSAEQTPRGEPLKVKGHRGGQFFFRNKNSQPEKANTDSKQQKYGSILYQIPNEMELGKDTKCVVRIAFEEAILREKLDLNESTKIQDIRVSNLMEVQLLDPLAADNFQIRTINETEQLVDVADFTQWLFYVKAKKQGSFPILLKVTVIEMLYGKERRKDIVLEETIEVVARAIREVPVAFKSAGYNLAVSSDSPIVFPSKPAMVETRPDSTITSGPLVKPSRPVLTGGGSMPPKDDSFTFSTDKKKTNIIQFFGGIAAVFLLVFVVNSVVMTEAPEVKKNTRPTEEPADVPPLSPSSPSKPSSNNEQSSSTQFLK